MVFLNVFVGRIDCTKKLLRKPSEINMETYKKYRNRLNFTLKLTKRNYFTNLLEKKTT